MNGETLRAQRRHRFRQEPARRVRSARAALAFVQDVGLCSTFYCFPDGLACLWEAVVGREKPRWPRSDRLITLVMVVSVSRLKCRQIPMQQAVAPEEADGAAKCKEGTKRDGVFTSPTPGR